MDLLMENIKDLPELRRVWANGFTEDDAFIMLKDICDYGHNFELRDAIGFAFDNLEEEMKNYFLELKYGADIATVFEVYELRSENKKMRNALDRFVKRCEEGSTRTYNEFKDILDDID